MKRQGRIKTYYGKIILTGKDMRYFKTILIILVLVLFPFHAYAETPSPSPKDKDIEKADKLGEEFQKQMPWSKERTPGGEPLTRELPQPPESQKQKDESESQFTRYPLCYNYYTRRYEYCYPRDSDYFMLRFQSPKFRFWWEHGRSCPPGYHFVPGEGCLR